MVVRLIMFRDQLRSFYGKYSFVIDAVLKGVLALCAFLLLRGTLGYMKILTSVPVLLVLALACAFLPKAAVTFFSACVLLGHLAALSPEVCLTTAVIFALMFCAYYVFLPGNSLILVLLPLLYTLHIPYAVPICVGLVMSPVGAVPVAFGLVISYLIRFVQANASTLGNTTDATTLQKLTLLLTYLKDAKAMWLLIVVFALVILVVYSIRRLPVSHSWSIAIAAGGAVTLGGLLGGIYFLEITSLPVGWIVAGTIISMGLAFLLHFLLFTVDYTRTEFAQFEDDKYYYYVKAVPKISVSRPDVTVRQITAPEKKSPDSPTVPLPAESAEKSGAPVPEAKAFETKVIPPVKEPERTGEAAPEADDFEEIDLGDRIDKAVRESLLAEKTRP